MSNGMGRMIKDLSDGVNIKFDDIDVLADAYNLNSEERQLLKSENENDLKHLGLKRKKSQIVLSYNHSCLCGPHTMPTYIVSDGKKTAKA